MAQKRRAFGQSEGDRLVRVLNQGRNKDLQNFLLGFSRLTARVRTGHAAGRLAEYVKKTTDELNELNHFLQTCTLFPWFVLHRGRIDVVFGSENIDRGLTGRDICTLLRYGRLDWVRQCQRCSRWFYASRSKNKSCSRKCGLQRTDEAREAKRLYMKKYHELKNSGKVR